MQANPTWWSVSMVIEAKATEDQDPFGNAGEHPNDSITQFAMSARSLSFAHGLCYGFMIGIYGDSCRIIRFDRSSAVVSKSFDYRKRPDILQRFFWRFSHPIAGDTIVGCDPAVRPLAQSDASWVREQLEILRWNIAMTDEELLKGRRVVVRESDEDNAESRNLILFDLLDLDARLFGRATMVWLAMEDVRERREALPSSQPRQPRLMVYKEAWRQVTHRPESDFYQRLALISKDVRIGLPSMLFGSDLGQSEVLAWRAAGKKFPHEDHAGRNSRRIPASLSKGVLEADTSLPAPPVTSSHKAPDEYEQQRPTEVSGTPELASAASFPLPYPLYQTHHWTLLFGDQHATREHSLVRQVVDAIGRPLKRFRSTRELVEAVRDAIQGIFLGLNVFG